MKNRHLLALALIIAATGACSLDAQTKQIVPPYPIQAQGGVGPAISGSTPVTALPEKARKIIDRIGEPVTACEHEFAADDYDVTLSSGIEMEFDSRGHLLEIEAPDNGTLGNDLVKLMLPGKAYKHLEKLELEQNVSSISGDNGGYKVEFSSWSRYDDAYFSSKGDLMAMRYRM